MARERSGVSSNQDSIHIEDEFLISHERCFFYINKPGVVLPMEFNNIDSLWGYMGYAILPYRIDSQ